jgi:hypothetical protein
MACTRALGTVDFGNTTATVVRADQSVGVYFGSFDPVHDTLRLHDTRSSVAVSAVLSLWRARRSRPSQGSHRCT